jgi:hypothetical protein
MSMSLERLLFTWELVIAYHQAFPARQKNAKCGHFAEN